MNRWMTVALVMTWLIAGSPIVPASTDKATDGPITLVVDRTCKDGIHLVLQGKRTSVPDLLSGVGALLLARGASAEVWLLR